MMKRCILYVDDDVEDFNLVQDVFQPYAHQIELIHKLNGQQAIEYLSSRPAENKSFPNLIVLDINMPFLDGKETLVQIRKNIKFPDVPVILLSTLASPLDYKLAEKWGAQIITKPVFYEELKELAARLAHQCGVDLGH
jgi:CheY-like chemotaxis protein